jgi:hypothetical protein
VDTPDLDGDGNPDVLYSIPPSTLAWRQNLGAAGFAPEAVISQAAWIVKSVLAIDMDMDGDLDPVIGSSGLRWFENQGAGMFGSYQDEQGHGGRLVPADVDADGDMDLVFGIPSGLTGSIGVNRNLLIDNPPLPPCPGTACLDMTGDVSPGGLAAMILQSPAPSSRCYVFASAATDLYPLLTIGATTYYGHLDLGPGLVPLADPSATFGPTLTFPQTDANGGWSVTVDVPDNPALSGGRFYAEAFVEDPALLPTGIFHQSNLLTVTIR